MCGPLALSVPISYKSNSSRLMGGIVYNSGRIFTYTILGLLLGFVGAYLITARLQSILSVTFGVCILIYLVTPASLKRKAFSPTTGNKVFLTLRRAIGKSLSSGKTSSVFTVGLLNGLLPCGMIYLAITSSFLTGTALKGSLFMFFFGLGTFPAMLSVVFFGSLAGQQMRMNIRKAVPAFLFLMAILLVLRGMNLGIPYISPLVSEQGTALQCH
jgi:uncharacterized protein